MTPNKSLIMLAIVLLPVTVWAATRNAASCSYVDVSSAVAASADGDIVSIPAGAATWSSTLVVTKAITLQGAGSLSTVLTASNPTSTTPMIELSPGSDKKQRVTGIGFVGGRAINIDGSINNSYCLTQFRIDHCSVSNTRADGFWCSGWLEGLIDHNSFLNAQRCVIMVGDNNYAWARPIAAGTSHALFIEDNSFVTNNSISGGAPMDHQIYHQSGGRTVIRHNTFDGSAFTAGDYYAIDSHGNFPYVAGTGYARGQPIIEVYNNTYKFSTSFCVTQFRGGSVLMHDDAFTSSSIGAWVQLWDEESTYSFWSGGVRTAWPAQDQVNNSFFWNNTVNGSPTTDVSLNSPADATFIQKDRDYFMHAPAGSGGYTYYTGTRAGGSQTYPTDGTYYPTDGLGDNGNTAFSAAGANAYYPYTPYTYPHPLQGGGGGGGGGVTAPGSPSGLRIQ
jgi:hypothetical protein